MLLALRILLAGLGVAAVLIAGSILVLGAEATGRSAEQVFALATGYAGPPTGAWPATMDSELRFYAALWLAYGVLLLLAVARFADWSGRVPWLAGVFFLGGMGRMASYVAVGPPHPFFVLLMVIELALPPVLIILWFGARRTPQ